MKRHGMAETHLPYLELEVAIRDDDQLVASDSHTFHPISGQARNLANSIGYGDWDNDTTHSVGVTLRPLGISGPSLHLHEHYMEMGIFLGGILGGKAA